MQSLGNTDLESSSAERFGHSRQQRTFFPTVFRFARRNLLGSGARVVRSVGLQVREMDYVTSARAIGASDLRIMTVHVTPQCFAPYMVLATAALGSAIIIEASLGFLGAGVPPPTPTWGNMLALSSLSALKPLWWLVIFPGMAITITVLAFNLFGDSVRDALDPRLRGQ